MDMPGDVKPRRPYRSERRREQAEETRERVLEAAARLFAERGFESATIAAIAAEAGVSPETVYAAFRNKRTLLGELIRAAVRGSDSSPVPQQAGPRAVAAAHRPARAAAAVRGRHQHVASSESARSSRCSRRRLAASPSSRTCSRRSMRSGSRTCARSSLRWRPTARCASSRTRRSTRSGRSPVPDLHRLLTHDTGLDARALLRLARGESRDAAPVTPMSCHAGLRLIVRTLPRRFPEESW